MEQTWHIKNFSNVPFSSEWANISILSASYVRKKLAAMSYDVTFKVSSECFNFWLYIVLKNVGILIKMGIYDYLHIYINFMTFGKKLKLN